MFLLVALLINITACVATSPFNENPSQSSEQMSANLQRFANQTRTQSKFIVTFIADLAQNKSLDAETNGQSLGKILEDLNKTLPAGFLKQINDALKPEIHLKNCVREALRLTSQSSAHFSETLTSMRSFIVCALSDKCYRSLTKEKADFLETCKTAIQRTDALFDTVVVCTDVNLETDKKFSVTFRKRHINEHVRTVGETIVQNLYVMEELVEPACAVTSGSSPTKPDYAKLRAVILELFVPPEQDRVTRASTERYTRLPPTSTSPARATSTTSHRAVLPHATSTPTSRIRELPTAISQRLVILSCDASLPSASGIPTVAAGSKLIEQTLEMLDDAQAHKPPVVAEAVLKESCRRYPGFKWTVVVTPFGQVRARNGELHDLSAFQSCDDFVHYYNSGTASLSYGSHGLHNSSIMIRATWVPFDDFEAECDTTKLNQDVSKTVTEMTAHGIATKRKFCGLARMWASSVCGTSGGMRGSGFLIEEDQSSCAVALNYRTTIITTTSDYDKSKPSKTVTFIANFKGPENSVSVVKTMLSGASSGSLVSSPPGLELVSLLRDVLRWEQIYQSCFEVLAALYDLRLRIAFTRLDENKTIETSAKFVHDTVSTGELANALIKAGDVLSKANFILPGDGSETQSRSDAGISSRTKAIFDNADATAQALLDAFKPTGPSLRRNLTIIIDAAPTSILSSALNARDRLSDFVDCDMWIRGFGDTLAQLDEQPLQDKNLVGNLEALANAALAGFRKSAAYNGTCLFDYVTRQYTTAMPSAVQDSLSGSAADLQQHTSKWRAFLVDKLDSIGTSLVDLVTPKDKLDAYKQQLSAHASTLTCKLEVDYVDALPVFTEHPRTSPTAAKTTRPNDRDNSTSLRHALVLEDASWALMEVHFAHGGYGTGEALYIVPLFEFFRRRLADSVDAPAEASKTAREFVSAAADATKHLRSFLQNVTVRMQRVRSSIDRETMLGLTEETAQFLHVSMRSLSKAIRELLGAASSGLINIWAYFGVISSIASRLNIPLPPKRAEDDLRNTFVRQDVQLAKSWGESTAAECTKFGKLIPVSWKNIAKECIHTPSFVILSTILSPQFLQFGKSLANSRMVEAFCGVVAVDYLNMIEGIKTKLSEGHVSLEQVRALLEAIQPMLELPTSIKLVDTEVVLAFQKIVAKAASHRIDVAALAGPDANAALISKMQEHSMEVGKIVRVMPVVVPTVGSHYAKDALRAASAVLIGQLTQARDYETRVIAAFKVSADKAILTIKDPNHHSKIDSLDSVKTGAADFVTESEAITKFFLHYATFLIDLALVLQQTVLADLIALQNARNTVQPGDAEISRNLVSRITSGTLNGITRMEKVIESCAATLKEILEAVETNMYLRALPGSQSSAEKAEDAVFKLRDVAVSKATKFTG